MRTVAAIVETLRPKQWLKNLLVFAAPAAAGVLDERDALVHTALAFVAFTLTAGGLYALNDVADVERDRSHPTKRARPVASGRLSRATALLVVVAGVAGGVAVAITLVRSDFAWVIGLYALNTTVYSLVGKHQPVIDVLQVSAGFVLRAIGGAVAVDVRASEWFVVAAMFGALLMVVGKRASEVRVLGADAGSARPSLDLYPASFLRHLHAVATGGLLLTYSLWAFETAELGSSSFPWFELSIAPVLLAVFRYDHMIDAGNAQTPEDAILSDHVITVSALVWAGLFLAGVYA